jgi:hypothetical protein
MRRSTRNAVRTAVPPILALGLVALTIHPIGAMPNTPATDARATDLVAPDDGTEILAATGGARQTRRLHGVTPQRGTEAIQVTIPAVAFASRLTVIDGVLRTPVLLTERLVTGVTTVVSGNGRETCRTNLVPSVVARITCPVTTSDRAAWLVVQLSSGSAWRHSID